jgi:5-methylcytosine-specific restriction protein A
MTWQKCRAFFMGVIMSVKKFCANPGCNTLCDIGQRYCEKHQLQQGEVKAEINRLYDKTIRRGRDKVYTDFYHSGAWEATRDAVLQRYSGIDLYAYYIEHRIVPADMVHHIVELKDDWSVRLDTKNLIPLSDDSHRTIGKLYKREKDGTQELLRELMQRWNREMKGVGRV